MKVKAKRAMSYGNRKYASGDEIEMKERDAKLLVATGRVALGDAENAAAAKTSQKRSGDARAAEKRTVAVEPREAAGDARKTPAERTGAGDDETAKGGGKKARGYKRRDMRAADTREDSGDTEDE
ncbi:hypothetical protein [Caballeronia zhejiangensis]|uniref:hypothetical protein n=1 Tax=Caballeronia zhejiangensis TaxID=871203 RepID=UPI00158B5F72|nr:hypothetical protein [Caballeronia zhejiangensis]MCG7403019.1 hypothetical protein [Caballeronia zhejiangensis]MCI1043843.1 hypothetical protein [Caballeronia zhejiangensis]